MNAPTPPAVTLPDLLRHSNQSSVARALGRSRQYVNSLARGNAVPSVAELPLLAEILRVDLDSLTRIAADAARQIEATRTHGAA